MPEVPRHAGRPTWAEVDLGALVRNYHSLESLPAGGSDRTGVLADSGKNQPSRGRVIPVIKADAYGHGAAAVARALSAAGAKMFAVAIAEEGAALRAAGISEPILVLEGAWPGQEEDILARDLIPAIQTLEAIGRLNRAAQERRVVLSAHLKIDSGMTRLGVRWDEISSAIEAISDSRNLALAGMFTHLSSADEPDSEFTLLQVRRFDEAVSAVRSSGIKPGELHIANSAGWIHTPELRTRTARLGIALYGYPPAPERTSLVLEPALTLKSKIVRLQRIESGEGVGYNRRFVSRRATLAATIPIGYADGYRRDLTGKASILVRGRTAPLIGAVSMDLIVADVSDIPQVTLGDEVVLLGSMGSSRVDASAWAELAETIPYEILCGIGSRIPRIYL